VKSTPNGLAEVQNAFENAELILPRTDEDQAVVARPASYFKISSAREILEQERRVQWVLYPYIESDATTLMSGERGTLKSFIALDWACRAALGVPAIGYHSVGPKRVLFISAEGKGLQARLSGWRNYHFPEGFGESTQTLFDTNLRFIERPVNLSQVDTLEKLQSDLAQLSFEPEFIIVDTLTRNSDGRIEESNSVAQQYLCQIDAAIRTRYRCAILLIHHVGKDAGRGHRGPSSLADNTEAELFVSRPDAKQLSAEITFGRVKDREPPAPFGLDAKVVDTGMRDGFDLPITTLVMVQGQQSLKSSSKPKLGKHPITLLSAIQANYDNDEKVDYLDMELRQILKAAGVDRKRHTDTIKSLTDSRYLAEVADGPEVDTLVSGGRTRNVIFGGPVGASANAYDAVAKATATGNKANLFMAFLSNKFLYPE
jgi:hypothetical protein